MKDALITLEIVTPDGVALQESAIDRVILHRREQRFERGSEVAVFPHHAPMLIRLPVAPARYCRSNDTVHLAIAGGFAEVYDDHVLIVTPRFALIGPHQRAPAKAAAALCSTWTAAQADRPAAMIGY
jgi:F-type H+-transporting ATPase subunit epsilon